jgi:RNA polymerase sigma factor (sigma-70 family)
MKSAPRFDAEKGTEAGFVAMVARRRLIDLSRRRAVRAETPADPTGSEPQGIAAQTTKALGTAKTAESTAMARQVARAMDQLPEVERDVIALSAFDGLSHQEIADHMGLPLGTVKTHARRGLMRVRGMMSELPAAELAVAKLPAAQLPAGEVRS